MTKPILKKSISYNKCSCGKPKTKEQELCASCRVQARLAEKQAKKGKLKCEHSKAFLDLLPEVKKEKYKELKNRKASGEFLSRQDFLLIKSVEFARNSWKRKQRGVPKIKILNGLNTCKM